MRSAACVLLSLTLLCSSTGCYAWNRASLPVTDPPAYRQYQVWTRDSVAILHHIHLQHDSLYGIPAEASRDCGTCVVGLPMDRVDSLRSGTTRHGGTAMLGLGAGVAAFFLIVHAAFSGWQD